MGKHKERDLMKVRQLLIIVSATAGVLGIATVNSEARDFGTRESVKTTTRVHTENGRTSARVRSDFDARAQVHMRGPESRPPGWSHGRKTGWDCRVGTRTCKPPGLR